MTHRLTWLAVALLCVTAVAGMVLLWPRGETLVRPVDTVAQTSELLDATLIAVERLPADEGLGLMPGAVEVDMVARIAGTGEEVAFTNTDETGDLFEVGQRVRLARVTGAGIGATYYVADFQRDRPLILLSAMFILAVIGFGRLQGVRALIGLAASVAIIIGFIVPAILTGGPPVLVAVVGALVVMVITLYLSHGVSPKTSAAVLGTAGALLLTAILAELFVDLAMLTGFTSEEARMAAFEVSGLSLEGLLLAGIVVGGLGVLDDVTISQASTVFELHRAAPDAGFRRLLGGALNVGRDHIAATINTLFLAYAGAALPLLILFSLSSQSITTTLTSEIVAVEIVRTLVGSIGLIAAVPLTTALAAALARRDSEGGAGARRAAARRGTQGLSAEEEAWLQRLREV